MKKTALMLMTIMIITKALGFGRDIILSYFYGVSSISDAYLISLTIPTILLALIGTGIATCYIPMYSSIEKNGSVKLADNFTSNVINFMLIICTFIVIVGSIFTVQLVKIFASGFEGETLNLAVSFTRVIIFAVYFEGIIYVLSGYLQLKNNFFAPAFMSIPLNIIIIVSIIVSTKLSVHFIAVGNIIAMGVQMLYLMPFVYKNGYKYRFILDVKNEDFKKLAILALPVIAGVSVNQINVLIDRTIASQLLVGGISALTYANKLNLFIQGIFVMSIATTFYPMMSRFANENKISNLKKTISEAINIINFLLLPTAVGAMLFAEPIVKLLFGRGAFDLQAISMTSYALFFYSIGMVGVGLREVLSRAFYSLHDTKTPTINAAIAVAINIIGNLVLSKFLGIGGLALATSISAIIGTALLFISLIRKIGSFDISRIMVSFIKFFCASLVMGFIAKILYHYLTPITSGNLALLISVFAGASIYLMIVYLMKIEDVDFFREFVKRKLKKSEVSN